MKTQAKIRVPMVPTVFEESESLTKLKGKKSSAKRAQEHREKERQKPGFDNEKVKEETCLWVAAIGARHPKCLFDRKSKDSSFKLHPENKHNKRYQKRIRSWFSSKTRKPKSSGERKRGEHHIFE